jgi:hypothetical protein
VGLFALQLFKSTYLEISKFFKPAAVNQTKKKRKGGSRSVSKGLEAKNKECMLRCTKQADDKKEIDPRCV